MSNLDRNTLDTEISARMDMPKATDAMAHVDPEGRVYGRRRGGEVVGDPRLANPFEDFEEAYPMAPVKVIEVTDEVRAADEAARRAREELNPEHPWAAVKATLSNDNLRTTKPRPATKLRQADERVFAVAKKTIHTVAPRTCANNCGRGISHWNATGLCASCAQKKAKPRKPARPCTLCGSDLSRNTRHNVCQKCRLLAAKPKQICASCPRLLSGKNTCGLCRGCQRARQKHRVPKVPRLCPCGAELSKMSKELCRPCRNEARRLEAEARRASQPASQPGEEQRPRGCQVGVVALNPVPRARCPPLSPRPNSNSTICGTPSRSKTSMPCCRRH